MNLVKILIPAVMLFVSQKFQGVALLNGVLQLVVFICTANVPALMTKRMSYVDIAWPWGLVTIGTIYRLLVLHISIFYFWSNFVSMYFRSHALN